MGPKFGGETTLEGSSLGHALDISGFGELALGVAGDLVGHPSVCLVEERARVRRSLEAVSLRVELARAVALAAVDEASLFLSRGGAPVATAGKARTVIAEAVVNLAAAVAPGLAAVLRHVTAVGFAEVASLLFADPAVAGLRIVSGCVVIIIRAANFVVFPRKFVGVVTVLPGVDPAVLGERVALDRLVVEAAAGFVRGLGLPGRLFERSFNASGIRSGDLWRSGFGDSGSGSDRLLERGESVLERSRGVLDGRNGVLSRSLLVQAAVGRDLLAVFFRHSDFSIRLFIDQHLGRHVQLPRKLCLAETTAVLGADRLQVARGLHGGLLLEALCLDGHFEPGSVIRAQAELSLGRVVALSGLLESRARNDFSQEGLRD